MTDAASAPGSGPPRAGDSDDLPAAFRPTAGRNGADKAGRRRTNGRDPTDETAESPGTLLTIWGAGGSAPTGDPRRAGFGGDTICFEIRRLAPGAIPLVVDLGSGAAGLGADLAARAIASGRRVEIDVLISHLHLDHVIGVPFFSPLYCPEATVRLHCGVTANARDLQRRLTTLASPPFCPVRPLQMGAATFSQFAPDGGFSLAAFEIRAVPLNHPGGCCGFRIAGPDGTVFIAGDHEHGDPAIDARLRDAAAEATVLLYDGAYDDEDYHHYEGWGHSTWQKGAEIGAATGARRTLIYHHQPENDDAQLAARDSKLRARLPSASLARQNMRVLLRDGVAEILPAEASLAAP